MPIPRLETQRLLLTVAERRDAPALRDYLLRNDAYHAPWSPPKPPDPFALEVIEARIDESRREYEAGRTVRFVIRLRADLVGIIGTATVSNIHLGALRAGVVGYDLDEGHVGHGYMNEALTAVIRHAFDALKLHRLEANYLPTNDRSGRVLRRLGFVVEGYSRDYLFIGGGYKDHIRTALTNDALTDAERLHTPSVDR